MPVSGPDNFVVIYEKEYPEETHTPVCTEWVFVCGHYERIVINQMGFCFFAPRARVW